MASRPVPIMPKAKRMKANSPVIGLRASAAWADVWTWKTPASWRVAPVVRMIANAMILE
jgi:hypothetical protein